MKEAPARAHEVARHYGIQTGCYMLAHFPGHDEWELFDLAENPEQLQSVYGGSVHADI